MNELVNINNYEEFKSALDIELKNQAEGFVRTGYLLKKARDTEILKESGYTSVAEFAKAEYGLNKDTVSRYIAINDRYAVDGYSDKLQEKYQGYGIAKLQEMLTLSDDVVDMLSPELSRREIQDVKREIAEEEKISDIEVMIEQQEVDEKDKTILQRVMYQYFYENREKFVELSEVIEGKLEADAAVNKILDVIIPAGIGPVFVRIKGMGKMMLSFHNADHDIEMLNVRNREKEIVTWQKLIETIKLPFPATKEAWEHLYDEPYEVKKEEKEEPVKKIQPAPEKVEVEEETKGEKNEEGFAKFGRTAESTADALVEFGKRAREKSEVAPVQPTHSTECDTEIIDNKEPIMNEPVTPDTEAEESTDAAVEKVQAEIVTDPRKEEVKGLVRELSNSVNEERYTETISIAHTIASKVAQILVIERNREDNNY
ncbi:hypothetical protein DWW96_10905 [Eubacterium sp. AF17-7]|uniref:hypothetical protein n=1 Tax=Eubacterium sp. AF17-7 TaxID=2293105 RepID=UPI000E509F48|nr:hypothetical protein [Eubacterium sp. AF17-7]RGG63443.1 hypothetical protein DWW96_10905 [Eubacterium sp. AF17-7]